MATENKDFKVKHGLSVAGGASFGQSIAIAEPTADNHAVTKIYTDLSFQDAVDVSNPQAVITATTANISLSSLVPGVTIDGVVLSALARVLVKNQTTASQNGIYVINASGPATRALDYDDSISMAAGKLIAVLSGTINEKSFWTHGESTLVVGTTPINFYNALPSTVYTEGFGINILPSNGIEVDSTSVATLITSGTELNNSITVSNLESLGVLSSLDVVGPVNLTSLSVSNAATLDGLVVTEPADFRADVEIDGTLDVLGPRATIAGNLEVDGNSVFTGTSQFNGAISVPAPTSPAHAATKGYVDNLLDQEQVEITTIDDLSNYFNGFESRFRPTYQGLPVTLQNPFNLLLSIDGIIQSVGYPDYVWQSVMPRVGFRIDNDGYIAFPEPIPPGSGFDARVLVGSNVTKQTKIYPFKAMDIVLGGY